MSSAARPGSSTKAPATSARRPGVPGRGQLVGAVLMVVLGSFLPWVATPVGSVSGAAGGGLWTFYAAMLGLAGVLVPVRGLAVGQGAVFSLVAVAIPVWQVVHVLNLVGTAGWRPGPGLVLVFFGGLLAAVAVRRMAVSWPVAAS